MTEQDLRLKLVNCAKSFYGVQKGTARHKEIVNTYNTYLPHPRGYTLKTSDNWCAGFGSAIAILCDMQDIVPIECSCGEQVKLWKKLGRWEENDGYRPKIGEYLYYDWQDGKNYATTDNVGAPDHVGIVVWVCGSDILVIEGNKGDASVVGYREMNVNGRYIRGYGLPDFAAKATEETRETCMPALPILSRGSKGEPVRAMQALLNLRCKSGLTVDGSFGPATGKALRAHQKANGLDESGTCGLKEWVTLLGA